MEKCIIWFRNDLRLQNNLIIKNLIDRNSSALPIFILDTKVLGSASKTWLFKSLTELDKQLKNQLKIYDGSAANIIETLIRKYQITEISWNRKFDYKSIQEDQLIKNLAKKHHVKEYIYNSSLLMNPEDTLKNDGTPYRVFTPFYKNNYVGASHSTSNINISDIIILENKEDKNIEYFRDRLISRYSWHKKFDKCWEPGEIGAQKKLRKFLDNGLIGYADGRNRPDLNNVSRLSPHIHFGEISPSEIANCLGDIDSEDKERFYTELVWREFSHNLLFFNPKLDTVNLQEKFNLFPWVMNKTHLDAWQKGNTGYPIVDAGMRELWETGYMHNRVRMIVGSFLVKNLLHHWHLGRDWFRDTLLDADDANNNASWQWVAGTGADAAPYFRIFNPVTQSQKFDPDGVYIRKYIPEISKLPNTYIHDPTNCPKAVLENSGIKLGVDYPQGIVNLKESRERALAAFSQIKNHSK